MVFCQIFPPHCTNHMNANIGLPVDSTSNADSVMSMSLSLHVALYSAAQSPSPVNWPLSLAFSLQLRPLTCPPSPPISSPQTLVFSLWRGSVHLALPGGCGIDPQLARSFLAHRDALLIISFPIRENTFQRVCYRTFLNRVKDPQKYFLENDEDQFIVRILTSKRDARPLVLKI